MLNGESKLTKLTFAIIDIIGANRYFVSQSGAFPKVFTDFSPEAILDKKSRAEEIVEQALAVECGVPVTEDSTKMWRLLGGLGSHDLSAMREALGSPTGVVGAFMSPNFWRYAMCTQA